MHWSLTIYLLLFCAAVCAGWVDSIAGGGGLIALPVLLGVGLPPAMALGTNRLQGGIGELVATFHYAKSGEMDWKKLRLPIFFVVMGSSLGSILVQRISAPVLQKLLPILLLAVLVYLLFSKKLLQSTHHILSPLLFAVIFGLGIGFYNGFFGPGTGSFWMLAYVIFMGYSWRLAAMYTKPCNFVGNLTSTVLFSRLLHVDWLAGGIMALGQILGASVGSRMVIHNGDKVVRPILFLVVLLMCVELLFRYS